MLKNFFENKFANIKKRLLHLLQVIWEWKPDYLIRFYPIFQKRYTLISKDSTPFAF